MGGGVRFTMARVVAAALAWLALLAAGCAAGVGGEAGDPAPEAERVLIFTHSTGFRHASIEPNTATIAGIAGDLGLGADVSADPAVFSDVGLAPYAALIFVSTSTKPLEPDSEWLVGDRRDALQIYVRGGGGIVGVHAASDSHYHWPWYGEMIGGWFRSHPPGTPPARVRVADPGHPLAAGCAPPSNTPLNGTPSRTSHTAATSF